MNEYCIMYKGQVIGYTPYFDTEQDALAYAQLIYGKNVTIEPHC